MDIFKLGGKYIYAQCNDMLVIFDTKTKTIKNEMNFFKEHFKWLNFEDSFELKLMCTDSKGVYFIVDGEKEIGIYHVDTNEEVDEIVVLSNMPGEIYRMIATDDYLIIEYNESEMTSGTYIYDLNDNKTEKISDLVGGKSMLVPTFIWENYYVIPLEYNLHMISMENGEEKVVPIPYSYINIWLDGDWLYAGSHTGLMKYNLKDGEIKRHKDCKNSIGTMKVYDSQMYLGYIEEKSNETYEPKIIIKSLKPFMWDREQDSFYKSE